MKTDLTGKTAVVTGSTAGVGFAIAKALAQAGANVVINGRKANAVATAVAELGAAFPLVRIDGVAADVGTVTGCDELVAAHPAADILVNNVGVYGSQDYFEIPDAEWMRHFEVNVMSAVRLSRAYLPGMMKRYGGRVLLISSEWALNIPRDMIPYGLTKAALLQLAQCLATRTESTGVAVHAILLGPVLTDLETPAKAGAQEVCLTMEETIAAFEMKHHPSTLAFPHAATAEQVANMVLGLASTEAAFKTGTLLHVERNPIAVFD